MPSKCRFCDEEVEFVHMQSGSLMPVVAKSIRTVVTNDGRVVRGRIPHWESCPGADKARKEKKHAGDRV